MAEEDYSSGSEGDDDEGGVVLGFAEEPEDPRYLRRHFFPSKIGGLPAWLDPARLPSEAQSKCKGCGGPLTFLLQLYAPINGLSDAFHRTLYVFTCSKESCVRKNAGVSVLRSQLRRDNPFYAFDPAPDDQEHPRPAAGQTAEPRTAFLGPWKESELVTDVEPEEGEEEEGEAKGSGDLARITEMYRDLALAQEGGDHGQVNGADAGEDEDIDLTEMEENLDEEWSRFQTRLSRAPTQCIRYCSRDSGDGDCAPLWPSSKNEPKNVPKCRLCGKERVFEFQVLPQVLFYAGVDANVPDDLDFTTIAVYTCSCTLSEAATSAYADEFAWTHAH